jgi:nucleoid-associated protein YgaU
MQSNIPKLSIEAETSVGKFEKTVEALFNPNQITINKSSRWSTSAKGETDTGKSHFPHGEPATLTLDLFFDTYEEGTDVRVHTSKLFFLTTVQEHGKLHRPPLCKIQWGAFNISDEYQCTWVLQSLNQRFTLFLADGMPVRATLSCTFQQWRSEKLEEKLLKRESVDVIKRRVVSSADTLSSIAAEEYEDPLLWRPIAERNNIHQPRKLVIGQVLAIPALRSRKSPKGK